MQKGQPFRRSKAIASTLSTALTNIQTLGLSSFEAQKLLALIPEYRSSGKGKGIGQKAEKGATARIKRASLKKRNLQKRM